MVKQKVGSRRGRTKINKAAYKSAKRRAARQGRSTAPSNIVPHDAMRHIWDVNRKPMENLSRVGLVARVNQLDKDETSSVRVVRIADVIKDCHDDRGEQVLKQLKVQATLPERTQPKVVHPGEKVALMKLVRKYGQDWDRMAKDIKLNYLQWTPAQLKKRIERMHDILSHTTE